MKKSLFAILCILGLVISVSCKKPKPEPKVCDGYMSKGVITAIDYRKCSCCGGYFIEIAGGKYRFQSMPENGGINMENEKLPLEVCLDWAKTKNTCGEDNLIEVKGS